MAISIIRSVREAKILLEKGVITEDEYNILKDLISNKKQNDSSNSSTLSTS